MKRIDYYIIRKYIFSFFYTIILITLVSIIMDSSERMAKFISNDLTFMEIALDYYLYFIPWINGELWPLFAFLSVIFFTSRMARDSEIIALLAAGVKYNRILRPMLLAGGFIAILHWVGENYVIPGSTLKKNDFESLYIKKSIKTVLSNNVQFFISPRQKIFCRYFQKRDSTLKTFRLETFDNDGQLESIIRANSLKFIREPNLWRAKDYEIRTFNGLDERLILGKGESLDTILSMHPSDFIRHSKQKEIMTTPALRDFVKKEKAKGLDNTKKFQIEAYKRTAAPFTILILTLIGACIGTRKVRGGLGMHLALGVGLGAIFVLISKFTETFANNLSFMPLLGVWSPNILFTILSLFLLRHAQK